MTIRQQPRHVSHAAGRRAPWQQPGTLAPWRALFASLAVFPCAVGLSPLARAAEQAPAVAVDGWSQRESAPLVAPPLVAAQPSPAVVPAAAAEAVGAIATTAAIEVDDHALFERGIGALEAGKQQEGQRLLEQLVARSPASALADDARRRLSDIYRQAFAPPDAAAAAPMTPTEHVAPVAVALPVDAPSPWRERARRTHRFESMLGAEAGDRVFFGVSSSDIGGRARSVLERQAAWIKRFPDLYVVVEGHADEPGDDALNRALSLERADKARKLLIAMGLPAERVDIDARGRQDRVASCDSAVCQSQNRRVVTRLMVVLPAGRERSAADEAGAARTPR